MNRSAIPWVAAAVVFAVHLAGNPHYGFFRDELYFIICGFHPQFGYVDQPPLVPLLSALTQLGGHSLFLLRAVPAVFAAAGVYTTCLLVTEYGGGAFAQILASLVFLFTGVLMSFGMKVSTDTVGLWTWPLLALLVVRLSKGADQQIQRRVLFGGAHFGIDAYTAPASASHELVCSGACGYDFDRAAELSVAVALRLSDVPITASRTERQEH